MDKQAALHRDPDDGPIDVVGIRQRHAFDDGRQGRSDRVFAGLPHQSFHRVEPFGRNAHH